jgi:CO/xanthine dehydrogenase Mo-binding subunit
VQHDSKFTNQKFKLVGTRVMRPDGVDKVTGRARYGADTFAPGQLVGAILRSPHAHAKIRGIDTRRAEKLAGVKAVITSADLPDLTDGDAELYNVLENCMARGKALYDGHAVAAVAASDAETARKALKLIKVDYKVLPHVTDVDEAMKPAAPIVQPRVRSKYRPGKRTNVAGVTTYGHGDVDAGFAKADVIIEKSYKTEQVHQGYIEPHACLASVGPDGQGELWVTTQGQFAFRNRCAALLGMEMSQLKVTSSEIGGGFGGKTHVWAEPVALALSRKANRPVKLVMSREDVFRASGPASSTSIDVKLGATRGGRIVAAHAELRYGGGAFPGIWGEIGAMAAWACYDIENVRSVGYEVVVNRPKVAAYRAPSAPMAGFAVESTVTLMAEKLGIDPVEFRLSPNARSGKEASAHACTARQEPGSRDGLRLLVQFRWPDLRRPRDRRRRHGCTQRRNRRCWWCTCFIVADSSRRTRHSLRAGPVQHRGYRITRVQRHDGRQPRDVFIRHGDHLRGPRCNRTIAPISGHNQVVADGAGVSFASHICDVEVDPETGATKVVRYTVVQDAGKAVHPDYVEGQFQGGAAQGIGWALNEEYVYGEDGRLQNPGFLDYRIPVCSDLPFIDTQILEIPNPNHPYGIRGVGETSIVPPLAAIANAVSDAAGVRMTHVPMSPPRILAAIKSSREEQELTR